jgi:hypothetical protein
MAAYFVADWKLDPTSRVVRAELFDVAIADGRTFQRDCASDRRERTMSADRATSLPLEIILLEELARKRPEMSQRKMPASNSSRPAACA